jgi:hypothetical protein
LHGEPAHAGACRFIPEPQCLALASVLWCGSAVPSWTPCMPCLIPMLCAAHAGSLVHACPHAHVLHASHVPMVASQAGRDCHVWGTHAVARGSHCTRSASHVCAHVHPPVCVCALVYARVCMCVYVSEHGCGCMCTHTESDLACCSTVTAVHPCMHVVQPSYAYQPSFHVCMHACVHACLSLRVSVMSMHESMPKPMHACVFTLCKHACKPQ